MPFADHGGVVAGFAKFDGEGLLSRRDSAGEVEGVIIVIVLPGENAGPGWRADCIGAESVFEKCSFFGKSIDGWGWGDFGESTPIGGNSMRGVIVRHNEENVWAGIVAAVMVGQGKGG